MGGRAETRTHRGDIARYSSDGLAQLLRGVGCSWLRLKNRRGRAPRSPTMELQHGRSPERLVGTVDHLVVILIRVGLGRASLRETRSGRPIPRPHPCCRGGR
eukprot:10784439-Heterocapsa_arctica.AAC.1